MKFLSKKPLLKSVLTISLFFNFNTIIAQELTVNQDAKFEQLLNEKIDGLKNTLVADFQEINGINFLSKQVDLSMSSTKDLAQAIGTSKPNSFVFLASVEDNTPNIHCYISKELVAEKSLNAGNVIRELGKYIDGNGGGQPFFASGKGKNVNGIKEALEKAVDFVK